MKLFLLCVLLLVQVQCIQSTNIKKSTQAVPCHPSSHSHSTNVYARQRRPKYEPQPFPGHIPAKSQREANQAKYQSDVVDVHLAYSQLQKQIEDAINSEPIVAKSYRKSTSNYVGKKVLPDAFLSALGFEIRNIEVIEPTQ